jgi:hypothetical protein
MFSNIEELNAEDIIESFTITAIDDYPLVPRETAEHFFITGFNVDARVVPEPTTLGLLGLGTVFLFRNRKK